MLNEVFFLVFFFIFKAKQFSPLRSPTAVCESFWRNEKLVASEVKSFEARLFGKEAFLLVKEFQSWTEKGKKEIDCEDDNGEWKKSLWKLSYYE